MRNLLPQANAQSPILQECCEYGKFTKTWNEDPTLSYACQNPGQLNYASSVGVLGTSIASLKLVISALLSTKPWLRDPDVVPISWRSEIEQQTLARATDEGKANDKRALKLGILFNDGTMTPHPPITRGLRMIGEALTEAGHKVSIFADTLAFGIPADIYRLWTGTPPRIRKRLIFTYVRFQGGQMLYSGLADTSIAALSSIRRWL